MDHRTEYGYFVTPERYEQLVRAEHDANHLKTLIADLVEGYGNIDRGTLKLLYVMYCGKKEEVE